MSHLESSQNAIPSHVVHTTPPLRPLSHTYRKTSHPHPIPPPGRKKEGGARLCCLKTLTTHTDPSRKCEQQKLPGADHTPFPFPEDPALARPLGRWLFAQPGVTFRSHSPSVSPSPVARRGGSAWLYRRNPCVCVKKRSEATIRPASAEYDSPEEEEEKCQRCARRFCLLKRSFQSGIDSGRWSLDRSARSFRDPGILHSAAWDQ